MKRRTRRRQAKPGRMRRMMNGHGKKIALGGGLGAFMSAALLLANFDKAMATVGKFIEPYVTAATAGKILDTTKKVELVDDKVLALARQQDVMKAAVLTGLNDLERSLLDRMDQNNREQIRLIVQALNRNGGIR